MQCWFLRFWLMCYGEWMVIRNLGGSQSCCVLGRDGTEVRRYKKLLCCMIRS